MELIFRADLQEDDNPERNSNVLFPKLLMATEQCLYLMRRVSREGMCVEERDKYQEMELRICELIRDLE